MIPTAYVARAVAWMLLIALVGLALSLELTHRQQTSAARTFEDSQHRQRLLAELSGSFAQAEAAERSARVDHSSEEVQSYQSARAALQPAFDQYGALLRAERTPTATDRSNLLAQLRALVFARIAALDALMQLSEPAVSGATASTSSAGSASTNHSDASTGARIRQDIAALGDDDRTLSAGAATRRTQLRSRAEILIAALLFVSLALLTAAALATRDRRVPTLRREPDRSLNATEAGGLEALSRQLQSMTEKEKAQLARSLHDELGGLLIAVKMDASWLHKRWPNPTPEVQARWERVFKVLDEGVDFKRRVVENLRPTLLDNMGLIAAVRWVAQETCERAGLRCIESYPEHDPSLSDDASILVFRLVQEALNNVVKHARATDVRVEMTNEPHELSVLVEDNGVGIDGRATASAALHGLTIMKLRVSSLGGTLDVGAAPHGGTLIRARLPTQRLPNTRSEAQTAAPDA